MSSLTRADLVRAIAARLGVSRAQAQACVSAWVAAMADALARGERLRLPGLGVLQVRRRRARRGRLPGGGGAYEVGPRATVIFRPSSSG